MVGPFVSIGEDCKPRDLETAISNITYHFHFCLAIVFYIKRE